ncbi:hypothetical protein BD309DRAFT_689851 [Dichomitus squalens]|nr:hypothetical protein BD309DRAFT_689851 [Dichomitus squalens]
MQLHRRALVTEAFQNLLNLPSFQASYVIVADGFLVSHHRRILWIRPHPTTELPQYGRRERVYAQTALSRETVEGPSRPDHRVEHPDHCTGDPSHDSREHIARLATCIAKLATHPQPIRRPAEEPEPVPQAHKQPEMATKVRVAEDDHVSQSPTSVLAELGTSTIEDILRSSAFREKLCELGRLVLGDTKTLDEYFEWKGQTEMIASAQRGTFVPTYRRKLSSTQHTSSMSNSYARPHGLHENVGRSEVERLDADKGKQTEGPSVSAHDGLEEKGSPSSSNASVPQAPTTPVCLDEETTRSTKREASVEVDASISSVSNKPNPAMGAGRLNDAMEPRPTC